MVPRSSKVVVIAGLVEIIFDVVRAAGPHPGSTPSMLSLRALRILRITRVLKSLVTRGMRQRSGWLHGYPHVLAGFYGQWLAGLTTCLIINFSRFFSFSPVHNAQESRLGLRQGVPRFHWGMGGGLELAVVVMMENPAVNSHLYLIGEMQITSRFWVN